MKTLAAILIFFSARCLAQTLNTNRVPHINPDSNLVSISNAVRIASGLRVGMPESEVQKYMHNHGMTNEWPGMTNMLSTSVGSSFGEANRSYPFALAGGAELILEMHCTKAPPPGFYGWSDPILDGAEILNQPTNVMPITFGVTNRIKTIDAGGDGWAWSVPEFSNVRTTTNAEANLKWFDQLQGKADLVLEHRAENWFERYKPAGPDGEHVSTLGANALADAIPGASECGRSLAVVVLPCEWMGCTNCQTVEEVASDLRDSLKAYGFLRVTVVVRCWGMLYIEMFPDGWPSHDEIERYAKKERSQSK